MTVYNNMENIIDFENKNTALALGYFDGVHLAHRMILNKALTYGNENITPVVFTFSVSNGKPERKSTANILTEESKIEIIKRLGIPFIIMPGFDFIKDISPDDFFHGILIEKLHASVICCGYDYRFGKNAVGDVNLLNKLCCEHKIILDIAPPFLKNDITVSSSKIRENIKTGRMEEAAELLGYTYYFELPVKSGEKIGSSIGIPTINQHFEEMQEIPKRGVYASETEINGKSYKSVTNIGIKPTVGEIAAPIAETHIIGFDGNLYGKRVKVKLFFLMRDERKMKNITELKEVILNDIAKRKNH